LGDQGSWTDRRYEKKRRRDRQSGFTLVKAKEPPIE
jgi:hypothetical protein